MDLIRFAVLGLGAGAVYGFVAQGLVLVYRASGVLNFAHGAIGMVGAYSFYLLRERGWPTPLTFVVALAISGLLGLGIQLLVMRPLRRSPALTRMIATLGVLTVLLAVGQRWWGTGPRLVPKLLPSRVVEVLPDVRVGVDRLVLLAIGVVVTAALAVVYSRTSFGQATSAVAQNPRASATLGISPNSIAALNWALGGVLSALGAIVVVNISGLQVSSLSLLVVPALAAALVGSFRSFGLTLAGGLVIGILEAEVAYIQTKVDNVEAVAAWGRSIPFLVIIAILVVRGQALPLRGEMAEQPPAIGNGAIRWSLVVPAAAIAVALVALGSTALVNSIATTAAVALIVLSVVVVTGMTGQLSLAQFALAGMGAWVAAKLVTHDVPFVVAFLVAVVATIPMGLLVGLPSLRTRGVNLAIATLGLALFLESQVLANAARTGGVQGTRVSPPRLFGLRIDALVHPERYAYVCIVALAIGALAVSNLRRGRVGRGLVAVRTNERAAAALGVSVVGSKLYAFGLAAGLAACGGVLVAFRNSTIAFYPRFGIIESVFVVVYAVVGGVGFVSGALLGAVNAPGSLGFYLVSFLGDDAEELFRILGGLLLVGVLLQDPNGMVSLISRQTAMLRRLVPDRRSRRTPVGANVSVQPRSGRPPTAGLTATRPTSLVLRGVTVRYGGIVALEDVSLEVRPGEVVGLIGPNGAGKTTLIDAATGFTNCAAGEILLGGQDVTRWSPRRRAVAGLGRSFQQLELFDTMTVAENLRVASDRHGAHEYVTDLVRPADGALPPAALAVAEAFELTSDLDRLPTELPYGRRRVLAIARSIAATPSVLLLDEPAAGLDESERSELRTLLRRIATDLGIGVLLVEHDTSMVFDTCDRVVVLDFGRKIAEGAPSDVRSDPAVVQSYLGQDVQGGPRVEVRSRAAGEVVLSTAGLAAGYNGRAVVRDVSIEVRRGEVVALLGPNGAGKTTTLLSIAGEVPVLSGEVRCGGLPPAAPLHRRARAGVGFVFEERSIFPGLPTAVNLDLGRGPTERALGMFPELQPLLSRRAGLLSGGEQQMLAIGRILAAGPSLLVVDELSLGLAPVVVQRLLGALRAAADEGAGVLLVEQRLHQAVQVADRAYVLRHGEIVLSGDASDVFARRAELEDAYLADLGAAER